MAIPKESWMNRYLEKRHRERAVKLGNSGDPSVLPELIELTQSPAANARRLAASAIGKLAGLADGALAVSALVPMLRDTKPQVRQYTACALSAYGKAAKGLRAYVRLGAYNKEIMEGLSAGVLRFLMA